MREEHVYLSDQLKTDEAKAGNIEHSLRTKLEALKQQIKGEGRTRSMYDVSDNVSFRANTSPVLF